MNKVPNKTREEILDQAYLTASDIKKIIPTLGIDKCRRMIEEAQVEMKNKNYYIPKTKPKIALTKIIRKKFGF